MRLRGENLRNIYVSLNIFQRYYSLSGKVSGPTQGEVF